MNKTEETIQIEREAGCDALVWVVAMCECVRNRKMVSMEKRERDDSKSVLPKGGSSWRKVERGTSQSRGLRDNLWEGKSKVAICLDHTACCALLIPLQLNWSTHILSSTETKLLLSWVQQPTLTSSVAEWAARSLKLSSISTSQVGIS